MIFNDEYVSLNVKLNNFILNITGYIKNSTYYNKIVIISPNPIDRMINYSGSGLPFPNEYIAFENTPNYKLIDNSGNINVQFKYPNSFYSRDGKNKVIPSIFVQLTDLSGKHDPAGGVVGHGRLLRLARDLSPARDRTIRAEQGDEPS